ncbi:hypothetical protein N0V82_001999 [Gnomoniopsis sp. IMI 355080]|nr:hypothetical protein N0V82_001999 [Gnomoniopsis sp. IMI 355080]
MSFGPTFGSFGDFISLVVLIKDISTALHEQRGSAKKYQDVIKNLDILSETVQAVETAYGGPQHAGNLDGIPATALETVQQIRKYLESFVTRLNKYAPALSQGGSGNMAKDVARKVQFRILEDKEIGNFQAQITGYIMLLTTLLEVTTLHAVQRNHDEALKNKQAISQQIEARGEQTDALLNSQTRELKGYWSRLGRNILTRLDFVSGLGIDIRRSTGLILSALFPMANMLTEVHSLLLNMQGPFEQHFKLEDATGKQFKIYMCNIPDWESLDFFLQQRFKGKKGARRVQRRHYTLQERSSHVEIDRKIDLDHLFSSRQLIDMSLFCRDSISQIKRANCPWCKTISSSTTGSEVQW